MSKTSIIDANTKHNTSANGAQPHNDHAADFNRCTPTVPQREKLIPCALEAEQSTLGLMLHNPEAIGQALKKVCPNDFYSPVHRRVCSILISAHEKGEPISETQRDTLLNEVGGAALTAATRGGNVESYAHDVFTASLRRQMIIRGQKITEAGYADDPSQIMPSLLEADDLAKKIRGATPKPNRYELHTFTDLASIPRLLWLIRGLILQCVSSLLSAASGNYKSAIALEMLLCIATGRDFHGREVMQGTSVYVAAEGFYTMYDRASAWAQFHGCELPENFYIIKVPVNLADPGVVAAFGQSIADLKPAIVVLDTLSQNAIGANENDNAQMADFVRGMMKLGNDIGAHVMVLHHNAKATGTFRGAGSIAANIDTHISMDRPENDTDNTVFVRCEKQRGKPFEAFALRGSEIELPYADEYGDPITSLVFEECGAEVTAKKEKHASTQRAEKTRDALMEVFDQLAERNGGVKIGSWKEEAIEERERNGLPEICKQAAFWSHTKQLKKEGVIIQCGTHNGSELWARPAATTSTMSTTT
jgi:hypothetical protein